MIEPDFDMNGRLMGVSLVPPLSDVELAALKKAILTTNYRGAPVVWTHNPPEVEIIQLRGRWEPDIEDTP